MISALTNSERQGSGATTWLAARELGSYRFGTARPRVESARESAMNNLSEPCVPVSRHSGGRRAGSSLGSSPARAPASRSKPAAKS